MSYEPPTAPASLPNEIVEAFEEASSDDLRDAAQYAEALAEHQEREKRLEEADDQESDPEQEAADQPDGVPSRASITTKDISGNQYKYWQWREGDTVKSEYIGPVDENSEA